MTIHPPIIFIGMSRSGTSLITRLLEGLGLFVGKEKTRNHEAVFFQNINKWFLAQSSGGLENPSSIKFLLEDKEARQQYTDFIRYVMKTPRVISFLGWKKYFRYRTPETLDIPWGWKDPRNTYTLPLWLDIFPNARIIHIYRHGVDVVNSLMVRRERGLSRLKNRHTKLRLLYWFNLMQKFLNTKRIFVNLRCDTLEHGLTLWEEYVKEARRHVINLKDRAYEIKYEELLLNPSEKLKGVANFCELEPSDIDIEKLSRNLEKDRAYSYLRDPELKDFAASVSDRLRIQGY